MKRMVAIVAAGLLVGVGILGYSYARSRAGAPTYRLTRVDRGPVTAAVSATGNLNAVITVQVGSQVSGQIKELLADFNTVVKKNQVIARIDPAIFQTKVNQAKADLDSSLFDRNAALFGRDLIAASDRDIAQAASDSALAQHDSAEAHERALAAGINSALGQLHVQEAAVTAARAQGASKAAVLQTEGQEVIVGLAGSGTTTPQPPSGSSPRLRL